MPESRVGARVPVDMRALVLSMLFLGLGLLVVWVAKGKCSVSGDGALVALILLPLVAYLAMTGRLRHLKGPGGLEARFAEAAAESASASVAVLTQAVDAAIAAQVVEKEGLQSLRRQGRELDRTRPIIMTMSLGGGARYTWDAVRRYVTYLSQFPNFVFVVFVDQEARFLAHMPAAAFQGLVALDELGEEFLSVLNDGRAGDLLRYPGIGQETLSTRSTNAEALAEMTRKNIDALLIVDDNRTLKGVVGRDQVVSHILLGLTGAVPPRRA